MSSHFQKIKILKQSNSKISIYHSILNFSPIPQFLWEGWHPLQSASVFFSCLPPPPPQDASVFLGVRSARVKGQEQKGSARSVQLGPGDGRSDCVGCLNASCLSLTVFSSFFEYHSFGCLQPLSSATNYSSLYSPLLTLTSVSLLMLPIEVPSSCKCLSGSP